MLVTLTWSMVLSSQDAHASHLDGCPDAIVETFGERAHKACNVSFCESSWRAGVESLYGDVGLFQISRPTWGSRASFNPWVNAQFAYELSNGGWSWGPWPVCGLR